jgi:tetratricopeptide (TPR) repeat protein
MYPYLVDVGAYQEALTLVRRDESDTVRAGFWHGLIQRRLGKPREAERLWREVVETELEDEEAVSLLEWAMAHYYLGDKYGEALASVLEMMRERATHDSGLFYLAGVGWARRGDRVAAVADFRQAVRRRRALAEGTALPWRWWHLVADLAEEPMQAALREFFEPAPADRLDRSDR